MFMAPYDWHMAVAMNNEYFDDYYTYLAALKAAEARDELWLRAQFIVRCSFLDEKAKGSTHNAELIMES